MTFGQLDIDGDRHKMQPRLDLRGGVASLKTRAVRTEWNLWRRADGCHKGQDYNTCEKGVNTNVTNLAIILGICIPIVSATIVLIYLHRRNVRKLRQEDAQDPHKGLDFGLGEGAGKGGKRRSMFGVGGEKSSHKRHQLSMDMNLSSPYLLPPDVHQSHDSVHSLARTFRADQDPYRTVKQYAAGEAESIRSFKQVKDFSYSGSRRGSFTSTTPNTPTVLSRFDSSPNAPSSASSRSDPFATPTAPEPTHHAPLPSQTREPARPVEPIVPEIGIVDFAEEKREALNMPDAEYAARNPQDELHFGMTSPQFVQDEPRTAELPAVGANHVGTAHESDSMASPREWHLSDRGEDAGMPNISDERWPGDAVHGQALSHDDYGHLPIETLNYNDNEAMDGQAGLDGFQESRDGLSVPRQQTKRLSYGVRPLPPDEVMELEDPEYRANRIRSFYKEYFDDREPAPPMPTMVDGGDGSSDYYEDYDAGYLGDAAYFDAETNAFVMPYAQPVTRRAMTPPPAGRFRGGPGGPSMPGGRRFGPRGDHGSVGGMSLSGTSRRPRAGSALGPRPGSSASARMRGRPMQNLPPPAALRTLPTPSKLKDDSFALFSATDFAPPNSIRDNVAGRSQSPLGERRQYQRTVPAANPLATAFDELSVLPSPHLLRKSSTFTGLDFAPPKKFKDADVMSDAGSIRSNRSGISAVQLDAIRRGAGRVSRLPGDTVFTSAALEDSLKPQWNMRP